MLTNALLFLIKTVLDLLTVVFLLRFYFQLLKVPFQNQAAQMIVSLTNFAVKPVRKVIPSLGKIDISTLMLGYFCQLLLTISSLWLSDFPLLIVGNGIWLKIFTMALLGTTSISIAIFLYAVLIQAILSWVNPYTPIAPVLNKLTNPILSFFRKFIPMVGNIDLSPLVFIITAQLLLMTIIAPLENSLFKSIIS
ncbi:MAG: YggT family protein [Methylotenera sp.]|uniref:YggT family protein n=1 Tax=Methylotenera sp. TaxID=2051956 RepID=UPI0024876C98|nr:YggT family protein [Methylotenera sp.]MDI1310279.1 YggT family protein [Methylotenera sp.]